jgi:hypothetical protein
MISFWGVTIWQQDRSNHNDPWLNEGEMFREANIQGK